VEDLRALRRDTDNAALRLERKDLADQRAAVLSGQRALLADFVLGELVVLRRRGLDQVRCRVREQRLLTPQQGESQQDVNQGTLGNHLTLVLDSCLQ
jgi:hypothetical protein